MKKTFHLPALKNGLSARDHPASHTPSRVKSPPVNTGPGPNSNEDRHIRLLLHDVTVCVCVWDDPSAPRRTNPAQPGRISVR